MAQAAPSDTPVIRRTMELPFHLWRGKVGKTWRVDVDCAPEDTMADVILLLQQFGRDWLYAVRTSGPRFVDEVIRPKARKPKPEPYHKKLKRRLEYSEGGKDWHYVRGARYEPLPCDGIIEDYPFKGYCELGLDCLPIGMIGDVERAFEQQEEAFPFYGISSMLDNDQLARL